MTAAGRSWLGLEERTVAVTGAGGGIGRATVLALVEAGARAVIIERNAETAAETHALAEARRRGSSIVALADVADPASVAAAAAMADSAFGGVDGLVNTAALLRPASLDTITLDEWNLVLSVNLTGYLLTAQAFARRMKAKGGGAMVHVASMAADHAQANSGAYSVTKAGVVMLSRQIATEWGRHGIRSNVVSPGMVETPMSRAFYETPGVREKRSGVVPAARIGQPQDMADAALFLLSPRASYISGDEIVVDGGFTRMLLNLIPRPGFD